MDEKESKNRLDRIGQLASKLQPHQGMQGPVVPLGILGTLLPNLVEYFRDVAVDFQRQVAKSSDEAQAAIKAHAEAIRASTDKIADSLEKHQIAMDSSGRESAKLTRWMFITSAILVLVAIIELATPLLERWVQG